MTEKQPNIDWDTFKGYPDVNMSVAELREAASWHQRVIDQCEDWPLHRMVHNKARLVAEAIAAHKAMG